GAHGANIGDAWETSKNHRVVLNNGGSLTVNDMPDDNDVSAFIALNAGAVLTVNGMLNTYGNSISNYGSLTINGGLSNTLSIKQMTGATLTFCTSDDKLINREGEYKGNVIFLTVSKGENLVEYIYNGDQTVYDVAYYNLTIGGEFGLKQGSITKNLVVNNELK
ncbi:MAG: hypothetical protein RRY34_05765, partial [Victivallaceae bacterium]